MATKILQTPNTVFPTRGLLAYTLGPTVYLNLNFKKDGKTLGDKFLGTRVAIGKMNFDEQDSLNGKKQ